MSQSETTIIRAARDTSLGILVVSSLSLRGTRPESAPVALTLCQLLAALGLVSGWLNLMRLGGRERATNKSQLFTNIVTSLAFLYIFHLELTISVPFAIFYAVIISIYAVSLFWFSFL
ncbi:hypothetical protein F4604DRAFT_22128 [Suillus subluteus]|nr:hypothetical protein F4604DRAFT_22128 [Suillus subluteus]